MKLSLLIITKNEEDMISECIESVASIADEIIVIDSFSSDNTPEIARKKGAKVYQHKFSNFSDQRNYAAQLAKGDWILYLDADEKTTPEFNREIKEVIASPSEKAGYFIKRKTFFLGRDWKMTDEVQRLFQKDKLIEWQGVVHETPKIKGTFGKINSQVEHRTHRDISQMVKKTNEWSDFEALLRHKANHPDMSVLRFIRVMITAFFRSYIKERGYRNGVEGAIESIYQAFSIFITYAKLWEMQSKKKST